MSRYKPDYAGVGDMLTAGFMVAAMVKNIEPVKAACEATAPVGYTGAYKAAFKIASGVQHHTTARAFASVTNDNIAAPFVEFGGGQTPEHRTMTKALGSAG